MLYEKQKIYLRHRRPANWKMCGCGCEETITLFGKKYCLNYLKELLKKDGYTITKL